jgi:hypothetical protein
VARRFRKLRDDGDVFRRTVDGAEREYLDLQYAEIVADFVSSGVESALVEMPGRKSNSMNVGLRKAVASSGARVQVVVRAGQVYLRRA